MIHPLKASIPPLAPAQVHVWEVSLEADAAQLADQWQLLSTDERERADRFAFPDLRRRFVIGRAWLRYLLGAYAGCAPRELCFAYGPNGKPELPGGRCNFNVSHSGERALIAVSMEQTGGSVGVDLEMIKPLDYLGVARPVLSDADKLALAAAVPSARSDLFFRLWVRHEARAKAVGTGIGTHATLPVYDLEVGLNYRAALATAIEDVEIQMLSAIISPANKPAPI